MRDVIDDRARSVTVDLALKGKWRLPDYKTKITIKETEIASAF